MSGATPKPQALSVIAENIPDELKAGRQFVVWRWTWSDEKKRWDKPPRQRDGSLAKSTDPATWCTFAEALAVYQRGGFDGIGRATVAADGLVVSDLDRAIAEGAVKPWADELIKPVHSYFELSPSGTGIRGFCYGDLPVNGTMKDYQDGKVEIYKNGKYLTLTGQKLGRSTAGVEAQPEQILELYHRVFQANGTKPAAPTARPAGATAYEIVTLARQHKNADKWDRLMRGDTSGYASPSEADAGLCALAAFYTRDPSTIDQIVRMSGLYREKWDRDDYRQRTIEHALEVVTETYEPGGEIRSHDNDAPSSPTSPPPIDRPVGGGLLEVAGDVLANSINTVADLPYLPLLATPGWLVRGWSHLMAGYPRVGKTDLSIAVIREWLDKGLSVLYFTEEPQSIWQPRLHDLRGDWSKLHVGFGLGVEPELLRERARNGSEDIVIVDAVRNLLQLKDEKDNSEIARVTNPWVADARNTGKTLLMLHHQRKGGGDHGEGIAGGHALMGGFDIVLEVLRDPNQAKNRRLLRSYARLIESREGLYERDEDGTFKMLGDPTALRLEEVAARLTLILDEDGAWQTSHELHAALTEPKPSEEQVRRALSVLGDHGKVLRDPPLSLGRQPGKTYRWMGSSADKGTEPTSTSNGPTYGLEVRLDEHDERVESPRLCPDHPGYPLTPDGLCRRGNHHPDQEESA